LSPRTQNADEIAPSTSEANYISTLEEWQMPQGWRMVIAKEVVQRLCTCFAATPEQKTERRQ
jgi:hypothetical protein